MSAFYLSIKYGNRQQQSFSCYAVICFIYVRKIVICTIETANFVHLGTAQRLPFFRAFSMNLPRIIIVAVICWGFHAISEFIGSMQNVKKTIWRYTRYISMQPFSYTNKFLLEKNCVIIVFTLRKFNHDMSRKENMWWQKERWRWLHSHDMIFWQ